MIRPHEELIERLDAMPGISYVAAHAIVSEVGTTLGCFSEGRCAVLLGRSVAREQPKRRKET